MIKESKHIMTFLISEIRAEIDNEYQAYKAFHKSEMFSRFRRLKKAKDPAGQMLSKPGKIMIKAYKHKSFAKMHGLKLMKLLLDEEIIFFVAKEADISDILAGKLSAVLQLVKKLLKNEKITAKVVKIIQQVLQVVVHLHKCCHILTSDMNKLVHHIYTRFVASGLDDALGEHSKTLSFINGISHVASIAEWKVVRVIAFCSRSFH